MMASISQGRGAMVVIQIKASTEDTFLYETTCSTTNDELIKELVSDFEYAVSSAVGGPRWPVGSGVSTRHLSLHGSIRPLERSGVPTGSSMDA
jgi:hypothetical protein